MAQSHPPARETTAGGFASAPTRLIDDALVAATPRVIDQSALSSASNRMPIHAIRRPVGLSLDGEWQFQLLPAETALVADEWQTVVVPELWTMRETSDPAHYTNVPMPFPEAPPTVPARNPVGVYRRIETLSPTPGSRTILHVGAAEGYLRVRINGVEIGSSTDSHLEAEFDITDVISTGENVVELRVAKWSSQTYLEDQDQWWHSGLSRSVYLYETPAACIADVVTVADYDPATGLGSLSVSVETTGVANWEGEDGWSVDITVLGDLRNTAVPPRLAAQTIPPPTGERKEKPAPRLPADFMDLLSIRAAGAPVPERFVAIAARFAQTLTHDGAVAGVARDQRDELIVSPWSAEEPHLETVTVALRDPSGDVVDEATIRVGFRRVEIVGRDLLVNGRRILIQGVNRHDIDPGAGRVMTSERLRAELSLLKRSNFNAIRTAHYPNDPHFLDLCDEYGFYVVDEADIEGHAFAGSLANDPRYLPAFHERYSRMVVRDRNHPSVILWSLGNETGYGAAHDALAAWSRRFDPTRPVHYEGAISADWHGGRAATDVVCPMYPSYESLEAFSADERADRPLILCEYAYSQGNSTGGLAEYWHLFETRPGLQGGFIWQFLDHALDPKGTGQGLYGGDFGDVPNDGYVMLNGLAFSDLTPKPALREAAAVFAPVRVVSGEAEARRGVLRIRNRQTFANSAQLKFAVRVETTTGPMADTVLPSAPVGPGEEGELCLPAPVTAAMEQPDALALTVLVKTAHDMPWAPGGTELAASQINLGYVAPAFDTVHENATPVTDDHVAHAMLVFPPRLTLWRAVTDNDQSFALDGRFVRSGFFRLEQERVETGTDGSSITTYRTAFGDTVIHRRRTRQIAPGDWVFEEEVELPEGTSDGLRVGMEFTLSGALERAAWTGLGPEENFPDRRTAALLARWERDVDELPVPYLFPQHNGTRGGVTSFDLRGAAGDVSISSERDVHVTVSRHSVSELEAAKHWWELPSPDLLHVSVDIAHRGVGMARLGPDTRPEHRLDGSYYSWTWRLGMSCANAHTNTGTSGTSTTTKGMR